MCEAYNQSAVLSRLSTAEGEARKSLVEVPHALERVFPQVKASAARPAVLPNRGVQGLQLFAPAAPAQTKQAAQQVKRSAAQKAQIACLLKDRGRDVRHAWRGSENRSVFRAGDDAVDGGDEAGFAGGLRGGQLGVKDEEPCRNERSGQVLGSPGVCPDLSFRWGVAFFR